MPRKTAPKFKGHPSIQKQQQELDAKAAQIRAELSQTKQFLSKAPELKEQVQRKQQQAILARFNRPARLEGPADFQLEYVASRTSAPPRKLRRERIRIPWFTLLLLAGFAVAAYCAWTALWKG